MKICYCDETGTGSEPIAIMVGIVIDSQRMHITKEHWGKLLDTLSRIVGNKLQEIHTRDFYSGNGVWRGLNGTKRTQVIDAVLEWFVARKHHLVYSSIMKSVYFESVNRNSIPPEVNTVWKFLGFHIILAIQKAFQNCEKTKGNTIFIFDNEYREELRFTNLINKTPEWSYTYYNKNTKDNPLNQIVDVPYFGDSKDVPLIQVADFICFFLRRYAEIKENLIPPRYDQEEEKVTNWVTTLAGRTIGRNNIYPRKGRCVCAEMFYRHAPSSIRDL